MKKSLEERIRPRLMNIGKRNKVLRVLIIPVLFLLMSFFHVCTYLHNNGKRLAMLAMSCLLFTVFSSFSFPAFIMGQDVGSYSLDVEGAPNVSLAQETELNIDDVEILVDDEVLADSDYSGTSHGYAMIDRYDAAEILESIGDRSESGSAQSEEDSLTLQNSEVNNVAEPEKMPEFLADDWRLVLINQQNSIPEDYSFTLGTIKNKLLEVVILRNWAAYAQLFYGDYLH